MRNYIKEDALFLQNIDKCRKIIYKKLKQASHSQKRDFTDVLGDLIQDSFIVYRQTLDNKKLFLEVNITEEMLSKYIMRIVFHRFIALVKHQSPHYFEHVPNCINISLDYLAEMYSGDTEDLIGDVAPHYSEEIVSTIDNDNVLKHLKITSKSRDITVLNHLLDGFTQKKIISTTKISRVRIRQTIKGLREKTIDYLGDELKDLKEGLSIVQDKRFTRKKLLFV